MAISFNAANTATKLQNSQSSSSQKMTYANALQSSLNQHPATNQSDHSSTSSTNLNNRFHTDVLSAVHAEFNSISKRALDIVVTGLPPSNIASDADQFVELCFSCLDINPRVKSTFRLGTPKKGKIQPLLITLNSTNEVGSILAVAKNLRSTRCPPFVRQNIFFNKNMTKAESLAAYNERMKRRNKKQNHDGEQATQSHGQLDQAGHTTSRYQSEDAAQKSTTSTLDPNIASFTPKSSTHQSDDINVDDSQTMDEQSVLFIINTYIYSIFDVTNIQLNSRIFCCSFQRQEHQK